MKNKLTKSTLKSKYVQANKSVLQVAKELGVNHKTVRRYLKKYGFEIKPLSQIMTGRKLSPAHRDKVVKTLSSYGDQSGSKNPSWKGGRIISSEGYVWIKTINHPYKNKQGYVSEHRLVMEEKIGRYLEKDEVVHHINGIKNDNTIENLVIMSHQQHGTEHWHRPEMRKWQSERMKKLRSKRFWSTSRKQ